MTKIRRVFYIIYIISLVLLILLFAGCGKARSNQGNPADQDNQEASGQAEIAPDMAENNIPEESGADMADSPAGAGTGVESESESESDAGDRVIYSINTEADEGKILRLDVVGRMAGSEMRIREIRVYDSGKLLQNISMGDAGSGEVINAPLVFDSIAPVDLIDMNFDGVDDLDIAGMEKSKTITHHYWLWNPSIGEYLYGFTLQNAELYPETGEIISRHNDGTVYYIDRYRYENTALILISRDLEDWDRGTEDFPLKEHYEYPDGEEILTRQEFTDYDDNGLTIREIREPVNGVLYPVLKEELEVIDGEIRVIGAEEIPLPDIAPDEIEIETGTGVEIEIENPEA